MSWFGFPCVCFPDQSEGVADGSVASPGIAVPFTPAEGGRPPADAGMPIFAAFPVVPPPPPQVAGGAGGSSRRFSVGAASQVWDLGRTIWYAKGSVLLI